MCFNTLIVFFFRTTAHSLFVSSHTMEELGESIQSLTIEDDWIDDTEAPIIHRNNPLINIVNRYRHEATEHKCLPTFDGNNQHYKTFRNAWCHFEMNWRKFLLLRSIYT